MDLNFSKKTRKIVASLLAVAILLGVLPVSGLTGNSSGAESSSSENSTKTIYVNSTKQPILFDSVGNFKEIIPKVKKNIYSTEAENGDKIALFTDIGNGNSVVFYKTTEWTPSAYMWKEDSSENPDKNAAWPGEAMKKYGDSNSSLYYYVYGSAKGFDKVIFNDGNDQKNGDQTDNKDLKAWNVYTKTSAGRPICDSLTKCDVSDNFNVYEYADSKLSGKNISAPQGMGATIEIAGTKYTVCGDGAKSEITCYEDDEITSLTANTVDGYTAKVTNSVVGDNQITYSVTYTNKTYGMQFSVENTVAFIKNPRLVLEGKWTVTFNGKKYENGDTICNQKDSVKNLEAAFKIDSVTFNGKEISGYDTKTTLNGNSFDSSCGSNELEKENKLVATVYYEADNGKKYSAKSEFSFNYAEGDVTLSENGNDNSVYFDDNNNIYTNSDSVTLTLNDESKIEDLTLELYKGDSTPDSKNKIENAIEFDHEKGTITIGNKDVKLSEIKKATLTITSSKYNLSKTYTISYDTISKDNLKYSNTNENNENNERYYVNAEKGVTVTFNLDGIDKKLFNDENAEVTCDKENGVKISFNKDNKEWKATITKSADYTFTFSNNGFVQTVKIIKQDLYLDDKAPEITGFSFQKAQSDTDKLLSFLTFGIYSNDKIIVTVNAKDEDILSTSSGIKNITLYDDGKILGTQTFNDYSTENTATFTLDESDKAYKLYAVVEDAVGYKSQKTTFDLGKKKDKDSYDVIEYNSEDSNGCLPELVSYGGTDKFSDLTVTPENFKHQVGGLFSYKGKGELFNITLSESLSALSEATVTVSKEGSAKSFSTNPPITFDTTSKDARKDNCKLDYDLKLSEVFKAIGVSGSDISGNYTITVVAINNAGVSSKAYTYDFSIDNTAPKPDTFTISGESSTEKILKFLTFGIYSHETINVDVSAEDYEPSSGIKTYTLYNLKDGKYEQIGEPSSNGKFTVDNRNEEYRLFVTVTDEFENTSGYYTFDYTGNKQDSYTAATYDEAERPKKAPELVSYNGTDKFSDLTVTPENFKHQDNKGLFSYKGKGELFNITLSESLSALSEATVTVNKDGSKKEFSDTVTFDTTSKDAKKEDCKLDYDLNLSEVFEQIGVKNEAISGNYTITVVAINNAGVSSKAYTYGFSIDNTAPEPKTFTISGESATDKILKFLTFGIYSKNTINVKVAANDADPSSGISSYTLYDKKDGEYNKLANVTITNSENSKFAEFTIDNHNKEYNLFVTVTDEFENTSNYYTFDYTGDKRESYVATDSKDAPEVVRYDGKDKFSDLAVTPENFKHQSDKLFSYKENGEAFKLELSESLSALSEATVTVQKNGSTKSFLKTITFDTTSEDAKKKDCKLDYDLKLAEVFKTIGVSGSDISGNYTITVVAINNAGVSSKAYTYDFSIDNTAPVITLFAIENGSQNPIVDETSSQEYRYYFQHNTNVTVTAKDSASGVKEIHFRAYDVVKKDNAVDETKTVSSNNNAVFEVPANFKGEIYAYAVDKFDNSGIDKNIQGEGEKKPDDLIVETQQHHNGNASVTMSRAKASYKDNSGLDLYSGNVNARVVFEDAYAGIKNAVIKVSDYTNTVTNTITVNVDNDSNVSSTGNGSVNVTYTKDGNSNLVTRIVVDYVVGDNSNNIKVTTSMTDRAGNKTDNVKDNLSIDKTKPVIDVKYDNNEHTTYGGNDYYKADRTATVTVTERNFDESLVETAIMRNGGRYTTIGGWTHNNNAADPDKSTHVAKIVYNTDGDFTFDIAVKDKAMNSADKFTQQKFTVDKTAPVIDVSFDNNSAKNGNYYKADRTATIKITEHNFNSGSQYVNIPVTAEGATAPSVVGWSGSGDDHNATVSFNKDGKYSFTVDYTDLAGNKAVQKKVDSFYIDKTAPEVEITGVADHQAYNGTVAPVVTYRDDNFTDDHDFKFTRIDINSKSDDTSKFDYDTDGNGVTEFIYKYRDFAEVLENDGIYNFTVELSDKAGNSTSKSVTFSVNRFGSTFKASDESEKLIKNGYTNAEQDIVVEEINVSPLTKHSVTLAKSGGNSTELVENTDYKFTSSNNGNEWCKSVYTVNKKNFSDEAAYTVTIMSVDKAKNTNNNRMADSSLSTEQKNKRECAISFVVDKTSPLVSITGIKDNELYKEASKKVKIVCEDDNLDKSKLVVTLDNKKLAEGEDYTIVDDKDGSIAGMITAEIVLKAETGGIKENLKVTIGDLAGNTGEKSVDNFILSANIFQRFFANPVLVICTFAGLALVIAAVIFFVAKKRKKAE
jgi:hypothetical protein